MNTTTYLYRWSASKDGSLTPAKCSEGEPSNNLRAVLADANQQIPSNKAVTILLAQKQGINANSFYLHQILK